MANYPTFTLEGKEKDHLHRIWSTKLWDVSAMPSKLYMRTGDGALVAIKPKFFVSVQNDKEYVCGTSEVFGFEKAGEGLCVKRVDTFFPSYDFFVSPGDYERYKIDGNGAYQIPILFTTDILREHDYGWTADGILLWHEENGIPKRTTCPDYRLWIDRDGAHIDPMASKSFFKSREECARTIPTAQVVDFDDEQPAEKKPELTLFEDRLAEVMYDIQGGGGPDVMDECCDYARKYSAELTELAKSGK